MTDHEPPTGQPGGPTMTDDFRSGPGAPPRPQRRLMRSTSDERIAGVAGGIGRYVGIDPVIVRIAFVLLALAGGGGIALYVVCWLIMPEDDGSQVAAAQPVSFSDSPQWLRVALIGAGALIVLTRVIDGGSSLWWGLLLIAAGVLLFRDDERASGSSPPPDAGGSGPAGPGTSGPGAPPAGDAADGDDANPTTLAATDPEAHTPTSSVLTQDLGTPSGDVAAWQDPTWPDAGWDQGLGPDSWGAGVAVDPVVHRAPARRPSPLGRVTIAVAAMAVGSAALVDRFGGAELTAGRALALALLVVGIGCLVGAFTGRGRGLIGVGLILLPLLLVAATVGSVSNLDDLRTVTILPQTPADLEQPVQVGAGDVLVDLRALEAPAPDALPVPVEVRLGAGRLRVLVPADAGFEVEARTGAGEVRIDDAPGRHQQAQAGLGVNTRYTSTSSDDGAFTLDLSVGAGQISIERGRAGALSPAGQDFPGASLPTDTVQPSMRT